MLQPMCFQSYSQKRAKIQSQTDHPTGLLLLVDDVTRLTHEACAEHTDRWPRAHAPGSDHVVGRAARVSRRATRGTVLSSSVRLTCCSQNCINLIRRTPSVFLPTAAVYLPSRPRPYVCMFAQYKQPANIEQLIQAFLLFVASPLSVGTMIDSRGKYTQTPTSSRHTTPNNQIRTQIPNKAGTWFIIPRAECGTGTIRSGPWINSTREKTLLDVSSCEDPFPHHP